MKIAVVGGTGYVGLTTALCLASKGHFVYCIGRNGEKIQKLLAGDPMIYEESLELLLKSTLNNGTFIPSIDLESAVHDSEISFICVGTPSLPNGGIDLSQTKEASRDIGLALKSILKYKDIVVKSTVVPGTTDNIVIPLLEKFSGKIACKDFGVCMNPEFLREGRAINDFLFPKETGIVIGELDKKSGDILHKIYEEFDAEIFRTRIRTAEMIKYARNCYLAKDVSFANEIADICQRLGVNYLEVKKGLEMDIRIGQGRFLDAGVGFGGSCFPKDVKALLVRAKEIGIAPKMLQATMQINDAQPRVVVKLAKKILGELKGKKIAVLGLAFKPGTDDMREAPSIKVVNTLLLEDAKVFVYDPKALDNAKKIFGDKVVYGNKAQEVLDDADACIIVTEWSQFAEPRIYQKMRHKVIIDGRRVLNPDTLGSGFLYHAIGFPQAVET